MLPNSLLRALVPLLASCATVSSTTTSSSSLATTSSPKSDSPFPTMEIYAHGTAHVWYVDVEVGDQAQGLRVDIAQPYLWILNGSAFEACSDMPKTTITTNSAGSVSTILPTSTTSYVNDCESYGEYNISAADTGSVYDNSFGQYVFMNYVYINGTVARDSLTFVNNTDYSVNSTMLEIPDIDFILVNESSVEVGALGLAGNLDTDTTGYNYHILDSLVEEGFINSSSYSLAPLTNETGALIFGAVDRDYYIDPLVKFSNIPYQYREGDYRYNYPIIPLSSITLMNDKGTKVIVSGSTDTVTPVLLDSRSSYIYLPMAMVVAISVQLNAYYSDDNGVWLLKCSVADLDAVMTFRFGNLTIDISIDRFIGSITTADSTPVEFEDGSQACVLLVLPNTYFGYSLLGMPLLRDTYLAVDVEGHNIAMAQANNENYKTKLAKVDINATTTHDDNLPYESSVILSGDIPFATPNNITESYTFVYSHVTVSDSAAYMGMTAAYSSGVVYTGRYINTTSSDSDSSSSESASSSGLGNSLGGDSLIFGLFGTMTCLLIGLIL